jgi:hypothetical protein
MNAADDKALYRRKYPRRNYKGAVGLLCLGQYNIYETGEIGEGGISIMCDQPLPEGVEVCVSFQIPGGGDFVSLIALIRTCKDEKGRYNHGLSFIDIAFSHKRQIRGFVSARASTDEQPD